MNTPFSILLVLTCALQLSGCSSGGNHRGSAENDLGMDFDLASRVDLSGRTDLASSVDMRPPQPTGAAVWQKQLGGNGKTLLSGTAADSVGSAFAVGSFTGTVDLGGGPLTANGPSYTDLFVVKFAADGSHLWSKRFGSNGVDEASAVTVDKSGNVYVLGSFQGSVDFGGGPLTAVGSNDLCVVKLSATGDFVWARRFGAVLDNRVRGATVDKDGNLLLTGSFTSNIDFGGGMLLSGGIIDAFVVKLAADGSHLWSKRYGGSGSEWGSSITSDGGGNVFFTGAFGSATDFGGGTTAPKAGTWSAFLVKLDPAGAYLWEKILSGDLAAVESAGVAADSKGSVLLTGYFDTGHDFGGGVVKSSGSTDMFLAKYGPEGAYQWALRGGGASTDISAGLAVDRADQAVVVGRYRNEGEFGGGVLTSVAGDDIFVAKYSSSGSHLWSRGFGSNMIDDATAVAITDSADVLVGGVIYGPVDFGGGIITPTGAPDSFLVRRAP